jgi:acyl carrier protein
VHVASVDVADEAGLRTYLQAFDQDGWPSIVGVIHAAGSLDVNLLQQMDWAATQDVLRPKVLGGWLLHKLFPDVELFVNISSINALLGLPGQGNYAAANAFLDSLSAYRHSQGQHSLSINWGVWEGLGYASTQLGAESSVQLAQQGIQSFSAAQGVQVFGNVLLWNAPTLTVVPADWQKYRSARSDARQFPLLKYLLQETPAAHLKNRPTSGTKFVEQLSATDAAERMNLLADFLQQAVAQILRTSPGRIKANEPLGSYGLNSLMGMELRNRLERDLGITLSATLVWNYPTIELMSVFLAKKLGITSEAKTEAVVSDQQAVEEAPLETLIADFATLSDDDILKELMDKS